MTTKDLPALEGAPYYPFDKHTMSVRGSHSIIPAEPIAVGGERQLLMDRHTVDSTWNLVRRVHQAFLEKGVQTYLAPFVPHEFDDIDDVNAFDVPLC